MLIIAPFSAPSSTANRCARPPRIGAGGRGRPRPPAGRLEDGHALAHGLLALDVQHVGVEHYPVDDRVGHCAVAQLGPPARGGELRAQDERAPPMARLGDLQRLPRLVLPDRFQEPIVDDEQVAGDVALPRLGPCLVLGRAQLVEHLRRPDVPRADRQVFVQPPLYSGPLGPVEPPVQPLPSLGHRNLLLLARSPFGPAGADRLSELSRTRPAESWEKGKVYGSTCESTRPGEMALFSIEIQIEKGYYDHCDSLLRTKLVFKEPKLTLLDVLKLMRHYTKLVVAVVVACTLAGVGLDAAKADLGNAEYTAEAVLTVSEPTATVSAVELMPLTQAIATNVVAENSTDGVNISQEYDLAARTISFTAVAGSEAESVEAANGAAAQTAEETSAVLQGMADQYRAELAAEEAGGVGTSDGSMTFGLSERNRAAALEMVSFTVNDASQAASNSGKSAALKYALVGFLGGLFLAVCIVMVVDLTKAPLKGREDVEKHFDVPVLAEGDPSSLGDRLWANVQFAVGEIPYSVCLVPIGQSVPQGLESSLGNAVMATGAGDVSIIDCAPLDKGVATAYAARDAGVTLICATPWVDSLRQVADTLRELHLAQAKVVGIVLMDVK